ncbi:MAG TPA: glucose-1-phosphate thymidylyltransferase RfbA [Thermotogota bacterium]|nr:glucose-1-phosphate thymidylyltransferase RfbA [Thermotogota bacterium]
MKGILLAGGSGSRLYPITQAVSKQLLPIYDKPMIYYPLSVLMLAGIKEILIITNPEYLSWYERLLGNGSKIGISIQYKVQEKPRGLADAFIVGEEFIGDAPVCLVLGDNVFFGQGFRETLQSISKNITGATIFGYYVPNPKEYGVVEFDNRGKVLSLEEKPKEPKSNYAVPGLYFYDTSVVSYAKTLKPSQRGELEITDLNSLYLQRGELTVHLLGRGFAWLDTGTYEGLANAADFVRTIQKRTSLYISCIEEVAYRMGFINVDQLQSIAEEYRQTEYGAYLKSIVK